MNLTAFVVPFEKIHLSWSTVAALPPLYCSDQLSVSSIGSEGLLFVQVWCKFTLRILWSHVLITF
jgi:hypothetical protein